MSVEFPIYYIVICVFSFIYVLLKPEPVPAACVNTEKTNRWVRIWSYWIKASFLLLCQSDGVQQTNFLAQRYCQEAIRQISRLRPSAERDALIRLTEIVLTRDKWSSTPGVTSGSYNRGELTPPPPPPPLCPPQPESTGRSRPGWEGPPLSAGF